MFDRVGAFVKDVRALKTEGELAEALDEVSADLGFRYFALPKRAIASHRPAGNVRTGATANRFFTRSAHLGDRRSHDDSGKTTTGSVG